MINTYGYNRKTPEQDQKIMFAVQRHHEIVEKRGYFVVMTVLYGAQNYDLDTPESDIDTFSLVMPSFNDLVMANEPYAGQIDAEDGHCDIKDIRVALNLLRKTSPNSVEYWTSKYKVINPAFEDIMKKYLEDNDKLWAMIHCNYNHMLYAMTGMAHQLTKRNMLPGKRFAHALRLNNMYYHFFNSVNANAILDMRPGGDRDLAVMAKRDHNTDHDDTYNAECQQIAEWLDTCRENLTLNDSQKEAEQTGLKYIDEFQTKLFRQYLMETKNEWQ